MAPTAEEPPRTPKTGKRMVEVKDNATPQKTSLEREMGRRSRRAIDLFVEAERAGSPTYRSVFSKEEIGLEESLGRRCKRQDVSPPRGEYAGTPTARLDKEFNFVREKVGKSRGSPTHIDAAGVPFDQTPKLVGGVWRLDENPTPNNVSDLYGYFRSKSMPAAPRGPRTSPIC